MMKLLWGPDLHMNTVHVRDVARAIWHVVNRPETMGQTYNLVDEGDSTQGSISAIVSELFNINHDYWGTTLSTLAKVWQGFCIILSMLCVLVCINFIAVNSNIFYDPICVCACINKLSYSFRNYNLSSYALQTDMNHVVEEVNDKHMGPWAEACNKDGVVNSPLSPYIDQELLYNKHLYLKPGKLTNTTGFTYQYPKLTKDTLIEVSGRLLWRNLNQERRNKRINIAITTILNFAGT